MFTWGLLTSYRYLALQHALHKGARVATIGDSGTGTLSREQYIKETIIERAAAYGVRISNGDIAMCEAALMEPDRSCLFDDAGQGWTNLMLSARVPQIFTDIVPIRATIMTRNEPF